EPPLLRRLQPDGPATRIAALRRARRVEDDPVTTRGPMSFATCQYQDRDALLELVEWVGADLEPSGLNAGHLIDLAIEDVERAARAVGVDDVATRPGVDRICLAECREVIVAAFAV